MHVALAAAVAGARLVHVSSDAVFSGTTTARYDETHVPDPTTPYGAAKAAAETAIKGITPTAVIARTSLISGDGGSQHERHVHALAAGAVTGALFTDDVRCRACHRPRLRPTRTGRVAIRRDPPRRRHGCHQPLRTRSADRTSGRSQPSHPFYRTTRRHRPPRTHRRTLGQHQYPSAVENPPTGRTRIPRTHADLTTTAGPCAAAIPEPEAPAGGVNDRIWCGGAGFRRLSPCSARSCRTLSTRCSAKPARTVHPHHGWPRRQTTPISGAMNGSR
jgi:hypothetical protein